MNIKEPPYTRTVRTVVGEDETGINPVSPTRFSSSYVVIYNNSKILFWTLPVKNNIFNQGVMEGGWDPHFPSFALFLRVINNIIPAVLQSLYGKSGSTNINFVEDIETLLL